jgi:hypothetical protein
MGITVDAIRKRVTRGTIPHERDDDGRVWVILDIDQDTASKVRDTDQPQSDRDVLISEMRDRIASLERQLEQEQQANSEHRRLLAQEQQANSDNRRMLDRALERIPPQLEAPREAPEAGETVEEEPEFQKPPESPQTVEEETERAEAQATTQHEQAQRPTEGVEHDASTLREWTGDVEARRSDAGEPQEGVQRPWWRRWFGS